MKRIMVPCDFSTTAKAAYQFAIELAERTNAEIFVLHVIDMPFSYESAYAAGHYYHETYLLKQLQQQALKNFDELKKNNAPYTRKHFSALQGPVAKTIESYIQNERIDLVVMGTNGAAGMKELFLGSNTEKIIRHSKVPVISIRQGCGLKAIKNIVLATDLYTVDNHLTKNLRQLQEVLDAKLHLVYVSADYHLFSSEEIMKKLEVFAEGHSLKNYTLNIQMGADREKGIVTFAKQIGGDMIAMATHGSKGIVHMLTGSLAEDLANHVLCPVWTCSVNRPS